MNRDFKVRGAVVVSEQGLLESTDVIVRDGIFSAMGAGADSTGIASEVDAEGLIMWPGLIDLHLHGARGFVIGQTQDGALQAISEALAGQGVTRHLLSVPAMGEEAFLTELSGLATSLEDPPTGSLPMGLHLEGPWLNPARSGAMSRENLRKPDPVEFARILERTGDRLKMITIAPELPGAGKIIESCLARGIIVSAGHTEASYSEMETAVQNGLRHVTHFFNAMSRFSHRSPGVVEAGLTDERLTLEIICDGTHVHPLALEILFRCRDFSSIVMISDSTAFEAPDGIISFMGKIFEVNRGVVRDTATGAIGGSAVSLWRCVCNLMAWRDLSPSILAGMASLNPARLMGIDSELGSIAPGKRADFFLAGPDHRVVATYRDGMPIWQA